MAYLITGATGLVGEEILRLCEQQKIAVHYLTTRKSKIRQSRLLKGFYWNPKKNEIDLAAFKNVTHIIHLAGATVAKRWTPSYKKKILDSRIQTTNFLAETLKANSHSVTQFISASAIGIYPNSLTDFYSEDSKEVANNFLSQVVEAWESVTNQFEYLDIKVSKIRIGLVLSDRGGALPKMVAPIKLCVGAAFGKGTQWQSWIHVTDLARLFLFVAKNNLEGVYNATAPNPVTQYKLMKSCAEVLKKPFCFPNIPAFVPKLMFGEMSTLLLSSQRVCSKKIVESGFNFEFNTIQAATENILGTSITEAKALLP